MSQPLMKVDDDVDDDVDDVDDDVGTRSKEGEVTDRPSPTPSRPLLVLDMMLERLNEMAETRPI